MPLTVLVTIPKGKGYRWFRKTGHKLDEPDKTGVTKPCHKLLSFISAEDGAVKSKELGYISRKGQ
jgi:hypothetical protein